MSLSFGKRDLAKVVEVLDADHESVEDAAKAILAQVVELYDAKAQWCVVGWVKRPTGEDSGRIVVGPYGTETQARNAGESLAINNGYGEEFYWTVVELWHGTPNAFHMARNKKRKDDDLRERRLPNTRELAKLWLDRQPDAPLLDVELDSKGQELPRASGADPKLGQVDCGYDICQNGYRENWMGGVSRGIVHEAATKLGFSLSADIEDGFIWSRANMSRILPAIDALKGSV